MKRQTKQQKREAEIAAIEDRLRDIALGAHGPYSYPDLDGESSPGISSELGIEAFARYVGGIRNAFFSEEERKDRPWHTDLSSLSKFDTIRGGAEYLWGLEKRAK